MIRWTAVLLAGAVTVTAPGVATAQPSPPDPSGGTVEAALEQRVERLLDRQRPGVPEPTVTVELVLDTGSVADDVRAVGGRVTTEVPGAVAQAVVPASTVDQLAAADGVDQVRLPRRVNRLEPITEALPPTRTELFGPTAGQGPQASGATAWLGAGITGAGVRVGVIDFFDLRRWNPAEHGPVPVAGATMFCQDSLGDGFCSAPNVINSAAGDQHGVAVVEIVKDMAPDAQIYVATANTLPDTYAAVDWLHANGVRIITRSLGAAFDGAGDGTGPLAQLVDYAAGLGMVWFNSAGNDAAGKYARFTNAPVVGGLVRFNGLDALPVVTSNGCIWLDGVRWNTTAVAFNVEYATSPGGAPFDVSPTDGTGFLAGVERGGYYRCFLPSTVYLRVRAATGAAPSNLRVEVGLTFGNFPGSLARADYSAAKPVVDSKSPQLLAVGAIDPPRGVNAGSYSSRGPTNDGRTKPDISAPAGVTSSIYAPACFQGTSAASPLAAGAAALVLSANPGWTGAQLAAAMRQYVLDLGTPGPDNTYGAGKVMLPSPYGNTRATGVSGAVALQRAERLTAGC